MNPSLCLVIIVLTSSALVHSQQYDDYQQQQQEAGQGGYQDNQNVQENENAAGGENAVDNSGPLDPSVPEPPSQIPETSFVCEGKPYDPGMYADEETGCRVYHMCYRGKKESFICGTGTVFNQEILSCDYPDKVDCSASSSFYDANSEMGKSSPEPSNQGGNQGGNQGSSGRPRPAAGQQPELGGSGVDEQTNQRGGDYETPRGVARPRTPVARPPPSAPRPSQSFESGAGGSAGEQPNLRPVHVPEPKPITHLDHHLLIDPLPVVQSTVPPLDPRVRPTVHVPQHPLTSDQSFKRMMIKFLITNHRKSFNEESIDKVTLVNKFPVNVPSREDLRGGK